MFPSSITARGARGHGHGIMRRAAFLGSPTLSYVALGFSGRHLISSDAAIARRATDDLSPLDLLLVSRWWRNVITSILNQSNGRRPDGMYSNLCTGVCTYTTSPASVVSVSKTHIDFMPHQLSMNTFRSSFISDLAAVARCFHVEHGLMPHPSPIV